MKTGYFANTKRSTKVHVVDANNKPICGSVIGKDMFFQWCSPRIELGYIECEHCKKHPIVQAQVAKEQAIVNHMLGRKKELFSRF